MIWDTIYDVDSFCSYIYGQSYSVFAVGYENLWYCRHLCRCFILIVSGTSTRSSQAHEPRTQTTIALKLCPKQQSSASVHSLIPPVQVSSKSFTGENSPHNVPLMRTIIHLTLIGCHVKYCFIEIATPHHLLLCHDFVIDTHPLHLILCTSAFSFCPFFAFPSHHDKSHTTQILRVRHIPLIHTTRNRVRAVIKQVIMQRAITGAKLLLLQKERIVSE